MNRTPLSARRAPLSARLVRTLPRILRGDDLLYQLSYIGVSEEGEYLQNGSRVVNPHLEDSARNRDLFDGRQLVEMEA